MLLERNIIIKDCDKLSGIYLLHNLVNGKEYIGSGYNLALRLSTYYYNSKLKDNRHISNSILKYGHGNFSCVILDILGQTKSISKIDILNKEQYYIDIYKPMLNINNIAGSSLGFRHSEKSKKLIALSRTGKKMTEKTKLRMSQLFSNEHNPFFGKTHKKETILKMKNSKLSVLNPMYKKPKSNEFKEYMYKDKSGSNNPMFNKKHKQGTLDKLRKKIYIYDINMILLKEYESITMAIKDLHIGYHTLKRYCDSGKMYKSKIISSIPLKSLT